METPTNVTQFKEIAKNLTLLYAKKNQDYGDSFGKSVKRYGIIAALTRMSDKFNRLENLILNKDYNVKDESLSDTLLDLAAYCIMTKISLDDLSSNNPEGTISQ